MGIYDNWTYTDLHQLNLDWIIKTLKDFKSDLTELSNKLNSDLEQAILEYLNEHIDEIILTATYAENTRTLKIGGNI